MRFVYFLAMFFLRFPNIISNALLASTTVAQGFSWYKHCSRFHQQLSVLSAQSTGFAVNDNENGSSSNSKTLVASGYFSSELLVKKSRFIGYAKHAKTWDEAQSFIQEVKVQHHPKARHVCFGFRGGTNPVTERCSDDGEPTGTAGTWCV
jgi:Uncharacterized protein family UPF0029